MLETGDFTAVRSLIPEYPGYGDEDERIQSDRLIRAWVGSCLASVRERLEAELSPELSHALDELIFRCQFPNQRYIAAIEHAHLDDGVQEHLVSLDLKALHYAQESCSVSAAGLGALVSNLDATFDERTPVNA